MTAVPLALAVLMWCGAAAGGEYPRISRAMLWTPYVYEAGTLSLFHLDEEGTGDAAGLAASPDSVVDELIADDVHVTASGAPTTANANPVGDAARLLGDAELAADGRFGGGLRLTGGDGMLLSTGNERSAMRTLEFWLRPARLPAQPVTLATVLAETMFHRHHGRMHPVLVQLLPDGGVQVTWRGEPLPAVEAGLRPGRWTHLAVAWSSEWPDSNRLLIHVNGRRLLRHRLASGVGPELGFDQFLIGNDPTGKSGFAGTVDEVRVSARVQTFYEYNLGEFDAAPAPDPPAGQPFFRDAADLLFHLDFNLTLEPRRAAPGTEFPDYSFTAADAEVEPEKVYAEYPPGVEGRGFLLGEGSRSPVFAGSGNLDPRRGTLAFWMQPVDWDNDTRDNRFDSVNPTVFGLFQVDGRYADGSRERTFHVRGPIFEYNLNLHLPEAARNPPALGPGKWVHVAMTWEGTEFTDYLNGERITPDHAWSVSLPDREHVGGRWVEHPEWWTGTTPEAIRFGERRYWDQTGLNAPRTVIDDFRVYGRPLAPSEIRNLAAWYRPRAEPQPLPAADMHMEWNGVLGEIAVDLIPLVADYPRAASARVRILKEGEPEPVGETTVSLDERRQAHILVETPPLEFAAYRVLGEVLDAGGAALGETSRAFTREPPPWWQNTLGVSDTVMPDWPPLTVDGAVVSVARRDIHFGPAGLPVRVVSAGDDLLAGPITLTASAAGNERPLEPAGDEVEVVERRGEVRVDLRGRQRGGGLEITTESYVEFDGMMWFEVTLRSAAPGLDGVSPSMSQAKAGTTSGAEPATGNRQSASGRNVTADTSAILVDSLVLRIPYRSENAELVMWWSGARGFRNPKHVTIGELPGGEGVVFRSTDTNTIHRLPERRGSFIPYVMLTGMARGMAWFAENDRGWTQSEDPPAVSIERRDGVVTLVLNIVSSPVALDRPRAVSFGLHPIPVRDLDPRWRMNPGWGLMPDSFAGNNLKGPDEPTAFDMYPENGDWDAVFRRIDGEGGTRNATPMKVLYAQRLEAFRRAYGRDPHPREIAVPGLYQDMQWTGARPEHTREWSAVWGLGYGDFQLYTPTFVGYAAWCWHEWITKTKGYVRGTYMDDCWGTPVTTPERSPAYLLEDGHLQPGFQFRGYRERMKRMRQVSWDNGLVPHHCAHTTHTFLIPYHSFFDTILDGEDFYSDPNSQSDFIDHWPLDRMRFMHNGKWGLITTWLGWHGGGLQSDRWPAWKYRQTRAYVANLALHDIAWNFDGTWMREAGLREPDTVFVPYWDDGGLVRENSHPAVEVVAWKRPGRCAVMLANVGEERAEVEVRLDAAAMGFAAETVLTVRDVDSTLLCYFDTDTTTIEKPGVPSGAASLEEASPADLMRPGLGEETELALEETAEDLPLDERRARDPDGVWSWEKGRLRCPVRRHDFRLFEFRAAETDGTR